MFSGVIMIQACYEKKLKAYEIPVVRFRPVQTILNSYFDFNCLHILADMSNYYNIHLKLKLKLKYHISQARSQ